jgi:hypothetical protein
MQFNNDQSFIDTFRDLGLEIGIEIPLLQKIVFNPELVVFVPEEDYNLFFEVCESNELYELLPKLQNVKSKVRSVSLRHFKRFE